MIDGAEGVAFAILNGKPKSTLLAYIGQIAGGTPLNLAFVDFHPCALICLVKNISVITDQTYGQIEGSKLTMRKGRIHFPALSSCVCSNIVTISTLPTIIILYTIYTIKHITTVVLLGYVC